MDHPANRSAPGSGQDTRSVHAEQRLSDLGIVLSDAPAGLGAYAPWSRVGDIVTTSGQFPWRDGELAYTGRVGATLTTTDGYDAARLCAISALAQLRAACGGDLARVRRIVRVEGIRQIRFHSEVGRTIRVDICCSNTPLPYPG
ncbi:RidA family protein [Sphingomonas sp. RB3P16]|uniref:RidA family protein n=1 Tax=Parasphingomonas frigoris TaxID=3096163 RepID=UPI003FA6DCE3